MNQRKAFDRGLLAWMRIVIALDAIYWFFTTWQPNTSRAHTVLVIAQAIVSIVGAVWLLLGRKRLSDQR